MMTAVQLHCLTMAIILAAVGLVSSCIQQTLKWFLSSLGLGECRWVRVGVAHLSNID